MSAVGNKKLNHFVNKCRWHKKEPDMLKAEIRINVHDTKAWLIRVGRLASRLDKQELFLGISKYRLDFLIMSVIIYFLKYCILGYAKYILYKRNQTKLGIRNFSFSQKINSWIVVQNSKEFVLGKLLSI